MKGRQLIAHDLQNDVLLETVIHKLAYFHSLTMPISKKRIWLYDNLKHYYDAKLKPVIELMENGNRLPENIKLFDWRRELSWLTKCVYDIESPIVFSHNDFRAANILIRPDTEKFTHDNELVFVDFDYNCYGPRGYDLAQFTTIPMYTISLTDGDLVVDTNLYPNEEKRRQICQLYLDGIKNYSTDGAKKISTDKDNVDHLMKEIAIFTVVLYMNGLMVLIVMANNVDLMVNLITLDYVKLF